MPKRNIRPSLHQFSRNSGYLTENMCRSYIEFQPYWTVGVEIYTLNSNGFWCS